MSMADTADINVDELRRRARRRLVGAVVLALAVAVVVPMLLETEQKPLGEDVAIRIPPIDEGKFVNRLNDGRSSGAASGEAARAAPAPAAHAPKYDTRIASAPANSAAAARNSSAKSPSGAAGVAPGNAPAGTPTPDAPAQSAPAPAPSAATAEAGQPPAAAPGAAANEPKAQASAASREGFVVQLAAFADDKGATALAGRLKKAGYATYTEPLQTSKGTLWRVRVGPYPSRDAAVAARDKLKTEGQSGIVAAIK